MMQLSIKKFYVRLLPSLLSPLNRNMPELLNHVSIEQSIK